MTTECKSTYTYRLQALSVLSMQLAEASGLRRFRFIFEDSNGRRCGIKAMCSFLLSFTDSTCTLACQACTTVHNPVTAVTHGSTADVFCSLDHSQLHRLLCAVTYST